MDQEIILAMDRPLTLEDAGSIDNVPEAVKEFCDAFCRRLVERYIAGSLSWDEADTAVNNIYLLMIGHCGRRMPDYAWEVFVAFDEGEIGNRGESFTRPKIVEIQQRYQNA